MGIRPTAAPKAAPNAAPTAVPKKSPPPVPTETQNVDNGHAKAAPSAKAATAATAAPSANYRRHPNAPPVDNVGLNDIPIETTHLMCEFTQMHRLSRNGPVNMEVFHALTKMDCGAEVKLAEAIYKREWSDECPILSVLLPGTRSGGMSGCRFDHPDEHSNGPMSSLRLRMNSLDIRAVSNGINECMIETGWFAMTKAERMFLTKGNWQIEWKLAPNAKENLVADLVNVYDWILLPKSVGENYYATGEIDLSRFPCRQLNGSFNALSAMRRLCNGTARDALMRMPSAIYEQLVFVALGEQENEVNQLLQSPITDHISTQNGFLVETDGEKHGRWTWTVPTDSSKLSMGIIRMDPNDAMSYMRTGPQLLCLSEMAEWNRLATRRHAGLIEWRLMGRTTAANAPNAWNAPSASTAAMHKKASGLDKPSGMASGMTSSGSATALAHVANALNPGAEVVLRVNANAKSSTARSFE
ncbi:unnamed protein product, partial [Symbiodinium sp. CCMP2592]